MHQLKKDEISSKQLLQIQVFSTSIYILSYLIVFVLSGMAFLYISADFEIPAKLVFGQANVGLSESSRLWSTDSIISIYTAIPTTCFIIGVVSLFFFHFNPKPSFTFLVGTTWTFINAFNLSLGAVVIDLIFSTDFHFAAKAMGIETIMTVLIIGVCIFFLFKLGIFAARIFHDRIFRGFTADIATKNSLYLRFFGFPWLIGNAILLILSIPSNDYKSYLLPVGSLILILPTYFYEPKVKGNKKFKLNNKYLIITAITSLLALSISYLIFRNGFSPE